MTKSLQLQSGSFPYSFSVHLPFIHVVLNLVQITFIVTLFLFFFHSTYYLSQHYQHGNQVNFKPYFISYLGRSGLQFNFDSCQANLNII